MTYTKPSFLLYQNITLTRDYGDDKDAMMAPNKTSHNNNCID